MPATIAAVPLAGSDTAVMSIESESTSVSFESTANWFEAALASESSATVAVSLFATGLSSVAVTLIVAVPEPVAAPASVAPKVTVRAAVLGVSLPLAYFTALSAAWYSAAVPGPVSTTVWASLLRPS